MTHITEDERQGLADGTLDADGTAAAVAHLAQCDACAADVTQLRTLMHQLHDSPPPSSPNDSAIEELWTTIRARIEARKVVELSAAPPTHVAAVTRSGHWHVWRVAAAVVAVAAAGVVAIVQFHSRPVTTAAGSPASASPAASAQPALLQASDSSRAYQQQVQQLLDEIEMQRAMLGPTTTAVADSDLSAIDQAIAELRAALLRDPNNAALRQLLATSYQQKLDLLKRLNNAS